GLLPSMVKDREPLYGLVDGSYWLETGRPRLFLGVNRHVLEQRVDWEPAGERVEDGLWEGEGCKRDNVQVIHPAALGDGVTLEEGARMFGRTVLGDRVAVRSGAELEGCVVFDAVEIGHDTEIVDAIICSGARIGDGAVVKDAIVGARSVVGARNELRGARLWNDVELPDGVLIIDD